MKLDLVMPVFAEETYLLKTQARSLDLRFKPEHLNEIRVMINDDRPVEIDVSWWGKHADKVRLITREDVGFVPRRRLNGWQTQQSMKLLGVRDSTADWAMVLDSKTWFVRDYNHGIFFHNNHARCNGMNERHMHKYYIPGKQLIERLLGIQTSMSISPHGVPNLMRPEIVRDMFEEISSITGKDFIDWFQENQDTNEPVTEFVCHSVYYCYRFKHLLTHYTNAQTWACHNLADFQVNLFDKWYAGLQEPNTVTASLHPRAKKLLSDEQIALWEQFIEKKGLA